MCIWSISYRTFGRSTRRLSPSWNPRNEALTSWSLWAATTQYAPPACCSECKDFLTIMCTVHNKCKIAITIRVRGTLPCSIRQNPSLHIHMVLCFFEQCITTRCYLLHKYFSYYIRYCAALQVRRYGSRFVFRRDMTTNRDPYLSKFLQWSRPCHSKTSRTSSSTFTHYRPNSLIHRFDHFPHNSRRINVMS